MKEQMNGLINGHIIVGEMITEEEWLKLQKHKYDNLQGTQIELEQHIADWKAKHESDMAIGKIKHIARTDFNRAAIAIIILIMVLIAYGISIGAIT